MRRSRVFWLLLVGLVVAGCGGGDGDGGTDVDGGGMADGGGDVDGGPGTDGGTADDGGGGGTDGGTTPDIEPRVLFVLADEAGDTVTTARLWSAPLGAETAPDLDALEQLSIDVVDGYDDYGEDHLRPALSPNGLWVAWIEVSDHTLHVRPIDGSLDGRAVSTGWVEHFAWAPDSTKIAFLQSGYVHVASVDGSLEVECGFREGDVSTLSDARVWTWAPDSSAVHLETSYETGGEWFDHNYVCAAEEGATLVDLTPTGGGSGFGFGAGGRVVYEADGTIYVDDAAGGARVEVGPGIRPEAAPDGSRFVYVDGDYDAGALRTAEWDGTGGRAVSAATTVYPGEYVFSPDASVVAFKDDGLPRVAAFDGSFDHVLATSAGAVDFGDGRRPTFSPDGVRIALPMRTDGFSRVDLYLAVTDTADSATALFTEGWATGFLWSDERTLIYWGTDASFSSSSAGVWESMVSTALDSDPDLNTLLQRNLPEGYVIKKLRHHYRNEESQSYMLTLESSGSGVGTPMGPLHWSLRRYGGQWHLIDRTDDIGLFAIDLFTTLFFGPAP